MGVDSFVMTLLQTIVVTWLAMTSNLPPTYDHPRLILAPAAEIAALRYPTVNPAFRPNVLAVYDDAHRVILLHDRWTGTTLADLSILVHEMAHHLQNRAGLKYACQGDREAPAYDAQQRFLRQFGRDLVDEFRLNSMALKLMTTCLLT